MIWRYIRFAWSFFFALAAGFLLVNLPFNFDRMVTQSSDPALAMVAIIASVFMIDYFVMAVRAVRGAAPTNDQPPT